VAPAAGVRPVPAFSRRALLAPALTSADNVQFKRNAANRLWALMMGRGLIHPLDLDNPSNPPSHPELLTLLADQLAADKLDVRAFLREVALSQTYQRSSEIPAGLKEGEDPAPFTVARLKPLSPEQLAWGLMQATGLTDVERKALGANLNEAALYGRLAGNVVPIVNAFAGRPGNAESFDANAAQALFVSNGALLRGWIAPRPGNLADRLNQLTDSAGLAEELYLNVFTRTPTAEESKEVADFLAARPRDRTVAIQDLVWALLASTEFRFNH
jgi:hypothetical protein